MSDELPPPPPGITLMSPQAFLDRRAAPSETPRTQQLLNEVTFISRPGWKIEAPKKWLDRFIDHTCQLERGLAEAKRDLHAAGDGDTWRAAYHRANEALQKCQQDLALALDHIKKDDKEIERLHNEIAVLRSNPSAILPAWAIEAGTFLDAVSAMRFPKGWEHVAEEADRIRKNRSASTLMNQMVNGMSYKMPGPWAPEESTSTPSETLKAKPPNIGGKGSSN